MGFVWSAPRPEVEVASGWLRGKTLVTPAGTSYHAFVGIPYAKPPVGDLRFKAPEPAEPWAGVRDASVEGNPSFQCPINLKPPDCLTFKQIVAILRNTRALVHRAMVAKKQSEDCLYLNVFVPESTFPSSSKGSSALRPVLFWIHGGAFRMGDGNPDMMSPELFIDKNIVVVTINYRLGPLGFLALGTPDVPGNAGMKDQALALKWTHDNVKAFGGNPDAITVYGESAGGASAHLIHLSPLCRGLFRGVIASSGSALSPWTIAPDGLRTARGLAKELGLRADTAEELAAALRSVSADALNKAAYEMEPIADGLCDEVMYCPVVEPHFPGAFLSEDPVNLVRKGKSSPTPLIAGVVSAEGLVWPLFADPNAEKTYKTINEVRHFFLPPDLRRALTNDECDECVQEVLQEYNDGKPFSRDDVAQFIELHGDVMFLKNTVVLRQLHTAANTSPLYVYRFDFVGYLNCFKAVIKVRIGKDAPKIPGAAHGDDLCYLSNIRMFHVSGVDPDGREMICRRRMVHLWANFIETGNPTPKGVDSALIPVKWVPCSSKSMPYLNIDDGVELRAGMLFPKQAFWEGLYKKYLGKTMWDAI